ncbi:LacI family DNA-binding transcriptional regulator [Agromyces sp. SYSU T0242]|uniref:LacI family DNA-binding transcriptional regulator n=1 Tax=Agromyces litoreus TaxID=3158561 RepID=UPI003397B306
MTAISDVARLAGVSKSTASRALTGRGYVSEATRQRVVEAAAEIGYIASPNAASLVTGRTKNVGVVIPFINRWFFGEVLEGIERTLLAAGYDLTLYNLALAGPERHRVFDYFLARRRVDAVIAVGVDLTGDEVELVERRGKPVIALGGTAPGAPRLAIDDRGAARLATEHLIDQGHTRIAHLAGARAGAAAQSVQAMRRTGFLDAMGEAGLDPVGGDGGIVEAEMTLPGGYAAGLQLLGHPGTRPTAVFAASDEIAFGVMRAAERLGISVPGTLSIIGFDGHEHSELFGLTTIEQWPGAQGRLAVDAVLRLLGEPTSDDDPLTPDGLPDFDRPLETRLRVRGSTTAPTLRPVLAE